MKLIVDKDKIAEKAKFFREGDDTQPYMYIKVGDLFLDGTEINDDELLSTILQSVMTTEQLKEVFQKMVEEKNRWIPVSERLPDDLEPVNITWINHEPEPYYKEIKGKPFTATGVYFNGQWYWWSTLCTDTLAEYSFNYNDIIDTAIEVIAWQPLPEPYQESAHE